MAPLFSVKVVWSPLGSKCQGVLLSLMIGRGSRVSGVYYLRVAGGGPRPGGELTPESSTEVSGGRCSHHGGLLPPYPRPTTPTGHGLSGLAGPQCFSKNGDLGICFESATDLSDKSVLPHDLDVIV